MQGKTWTFKEIDQEHGTRKGEAFIAFKRLKDGFEEEQDFVYLDAVADMEEIAALRDAGRVYTASINVVLITESGYAAISEYLS